MVAAPVAPRPTAKARARVLCVDDEPAVLEGLSLTLRRNFEVMTAPGGAAALEVLRQHADVAAVMSDMRMPGMDGATFLGEVRALRPDSVRLLLTGQADMESAIAAVNNGQIFRFLTKPCPPPSLIAAMEAAVAQHRLVTAERELLEQTLHGSIKLLADVLALSNPVAFGRSLRVKQLVSELCAVLAITERWQVEVAAMLAQLGVISLPAETIDKLGGQLPLTDDEQKMVAKLPAVAEQLLANIPRLEPVRAIIAAAAAPTIAPPPPGDVKKEQLARWAHVLRIAQDFDVLEAEAGSLAQAIDTMRGRAGRYPPDLVAAIATVRAVGAGGDDVRELALAALRPGMVLAQDLKLVSGALLATRGYEITAGFVERAKNFKAGAVKEPVRVIVRG
ncbi:MAG: response regulator [Deltaproteobacteria bacterium]|nr:response regulator [Deltaproteobacteria bacterium]